MKKQCNHTWTYESKLLLSEPPQRNRICSQCGRHEHLMWYDLDNEVIAKTNWDGIILAPKWEKSTGCVNERKQFKERGLPILLYSDIMEGNKK